MQLFSCKFCEIFKSTFFIEHLRWLLWKIAGRDSQNIDEVLHCSRLFVISENFWYISSIAKQKGESGAYHRKFSFFRKFDVLCFVETPVLRFALLPYCRRFEMVKIDFQKMQQWGNAKLGRNYNLQKWPRQKQPFIYFSEYRPTG